MISINPSSISPLHSAVHAKPYSILSRLSLAEEYERLGYPDLASSEAYMSLLLIDEVRDEYGEYHTEACDAATQDWDDDALGGYGGNIEEINGEAKVLDWVSKRIERRTYEMLVANLIRCDNLKSAADFLWRRLPSEHWDDRFRELESQLQERLELCFKSKQDLHWRDIIEEFPDRGLVRRELYPWNGHEPDRFSQDSLGFLNQQMRSVAPKLEVRATELPDLTPGNKELGATIKQLGLFALEDLEPGDIVLNETSMLTATSRLHDTFCDACSATLPSLSKQQEEGSTVVSCPECGESVFCSDNCLELAQSSYHPATCGADVSSISKDAPAEEAADALHSLLLLRVFAMSVHQDVHPLDLPEVKYIWGGYNSIQTAAPFNDGFKGFARTLPFSFHANVLLPIHMLEKVDVNIFTTSHLYGTWVSNTLYAKFRGTASARQGRDGRPEVAAVHPLWCLANHSCDPNVAWEWHGLMKLWMRKERVRWLGKSDPAPAGLLKGQEVMSHYCDVELPVKERREWASGALGGLCQCERCIWEAKQDKSGPE